MHIQIKHEQILETHRYYFQKLEIVTRMSVLRKSQELKAKYNKDYYRERKCAARQHATVMNVDGSTIFQLLELDSYHEAVEELFSSKFQSFTRADKFYDVTFQEM